MITEPTFLILAAVAPGPLHGYAILREVERLSGGRVRLRAGTLYAAVDRLVEHGELAEAGDEVVDGRLRRYYRLTDAGASLLAAETEVLTANADAARGQLARRGDA
ncbi:MAG TPA: PadR family transcriptional regulator [Acidimicrobiales bacterium]|nr:PadR family transcriptional regulator [Acidimicrobiales bacterium]